MASVLMRANKIQNTYGGRYSAITMNGRGTKISIRRAEGDDSYNVFFEEGVPLKLSEIIVDGVPLLTALHQN